MAQWKSNFLYVAMTMLFLSQNLMAPNLSAIAMDLQNERRDTLAAQSSFFSTILPMPFALLLALFSDLTVYKVELFSMILLFGELATLSIAFASTTDQLLLAQLANGIAIASSVPVSFSLLGDLFDYNHRFGASALLSSSMGIGMLLGQIISGYLGPLYGWRTPYVLLSIPGLLIAPIFKVLLKDIHFKNNSKKNAKNNIDCHDDKLFKHEPTTNWLSVIKTRSNLLLILQGIPGSIPIGVCFVYLNDFLATEKKMGVQQATQLMVLFGIGSALGGIFGGKIGEYLYKKSKRLLSLFLGICTVCTVIPMYLLINHSFANDSTTKFQICSILAGILVCCSGSNIRALLLIVNSPQSRGTVLCVSNLVCNAGRGIGPILANFLISTMGSRMMAFNYLISLWIVCGIMLALTSLSIPSDEFRLKRFKSTPYPLVRKSVYPSYEKCNNSDEIFVQVC